MIRVNFRPVINIQRTIYLEPEEYDRVVKEAAEKKVEIKKKEVDE